MKNCMSHASVRKLCYTLGGPRVGSRGISLVWRDQGVFLEEATSVMKPLHSLHCGKGATELLGRRLIRGVFLTPFKSKLPPVQDPFCSPVFLSKLLSLGLIDSGGEDYGRENKGSSGFRNETL